MKRYSKTKNRAYHGLLRAAIFVSMALAFPVQAGQVMLAQSPLAAASASTVKPNILFILDDSGSMARSFSPDWADDHGTQAYITSNPDFNGVAYNPAIRYLPPTMFTTSGALDTATYPSMTGVSVATGADTAFGLPNWKKVKYDGYGKQANPNNGDGRCPDGTGTATCNIDVSTFRPFFHIFVAGEYCTLPTLQVCNVQAAPTATYSYPATLRWCSATSLATGTCRKAHSDATYKYPRYPTPSATTITFSSLSGTPSITSFTVNGKQIMSGAASASSTTALAIAVRDKINDCNGKITGSCTVAGYGATSSGSSVTITAGLDAVTPTAIVKSGTVTVSSMSPTFSRLGAGTLTSTPGYNIQTVIVPGTVPVYPYPGTTTKASTRSDCAASLCTGNEEMTNYANWFSYYHSRMQMMKTSVSHAFKLVDNRYRVGFGTINNSTYTDSSEFLNVRDFTFDGTTSGQKYSWYAKFFNQTTGSSTPLRSALSKAGRYFANKLTGQIDPMQYACQKNFSILTSDGYWNIDTATDVKTVTGGTLGNMDGGTTLRPFFEGPTPSSGSLADVAKYYRDTDLRTSGLVNCSGVLGTDVCGTAVQDPTQVMTTFTLGLGVDGSLQFQSDYKSATSGDYYNIKTGSGSPNNWPVPAQNTDTAVDDMWHAAVNGGGTYFSAKDPASLASGLNTALSEIGAIIGAGASAATSSLNPTAGDNFIYVATYTTGAWTGNLVAYELNLTTGVTSTTPAWCVEDVVDPVTSATTCTGKMASRQLTPHSDNRTILFKSGSGLANFTYSNLVAAGKGSYFDNAYVSSRFSQWIALDPVLQQPFASGDNLVNFLRGHTGYENKPATIDVNKRLFRTRTATLGDAIESQPAFVGKPTYSYTDPGYDAFKTAQATRPRTVYLGTNDGMLHAFNASEVVGDPQRGQERWAYVPSMVLPNMWRLADSNYATQHVNFVNGSPYIADVYDGANWRTILVGGLNAGGRGYYALDITNPLSPTLLWEIDPTTAGFGNLGYSFGFPVVTKMASGSWVVLFTSGYDNGTLDGTGGANAPAGNGRGYLYVVNALTGSLVQTFGTNTGTAASPSGLAQISSWADYAEQNNLATYTYGGDLEGNVWRFDINAAPSATNPFKLAVLRDSTNVTQPITTAPGLGKIKGKRVIFVGTGKYLEQSDLLTTQQQTLYAFSDDTSASPTTLYAPHASMQQQTITNINGNTERTVSEAAVDFSIQRGWYINFIDPGERINVNPSLILGAIIAPTIVPQGTVCNPGGYGWLNYFNYKTGGTAIGSEGNLAGQKTSSPIVGPPPIPRLPNGDYAPQIPLGDGSIIKPGKKLGLSGANSGFNAHKIIWRELRQ